MEDDYRIQIYKRKAGSLYAYARVKYGDDERYYRVGYKDYEEAVAILRAPQIEIDQSEEELAMDVWGESVAFEPEVIEYFCQDSPEAIMPRLRLTLEDKRFTFSFSALSSQMAPTGTYEMTDTELILTSDNGSDKKYVFQKEG